jgi:phospholipase/carboxylesterase
MNRIRTGTPKAAPARIARVDDGQAKLETASHGTPHTLFAPMHYERGYAYPLIVWMHGPGDDENQLKRIMPLVSMRNHVAVAPRGTGLVTGEGGGHTWCEDEEAVMLAEQRVEHCIRQAAKRYHVHPGRVFIAGYDCGGTAALRVGLNRPDLFAGILSIGGMFPQGNRPLLRIKQCRDLSLFVAHGRDSREYASDRLCDDLRLFHTAGLSVTLRQYPCGHDITTQMLADMNAWIMEQVTGVESFARDLSRQPPAEAN